MTDKPPLHFVKAFGALRPANRAAEQAMQAINGKVVVKLSGMTRNQRRRGFYWTLLDVTAEVLASSTDTPWDAETLHDEVRKALRFGTELKTPSGRTVFKPRSTADRNMSEVDRAAWTDRVVNFCQQITGIEAQTLIDEVRSRGETPSIGEEAA